MAEPITRPRVTIPALLAALLTAAPVVAQGIAGAAIAGRVLDADSAPIAAAVVQVANGANGERWRTTTGSSGRYFLEYLSVGGPYRIEVLAVGYEPARRDLLVLVLGQRVTADFTLRPAVLELGEITITVEDERLTAGRTGPAQVVSDSTIARLPIRNRDYTSLARLSPQVTISPNGGLSFAGQHDRYNGIRIDGTTNADPFGRSQSGTGTPGWAVGLTAFTPEAVQELQIVSAPFDVRFGGFAGGLLNAVTRSGSNRLEGSITGYLESAGLTGTDATGARADDFDRKELSLTLGGPIVHDRAALFVNAALGQETIPQSVPVPVPSGGPPGIAYADLVRFQELLAANGVPPGSFSAGATHTPTSNLFVKLTAQPGVNSRLALSHNHGHGSVRDEAGTRSLDFYSLSSSGSEDRETIDATRLAWTTSLGGRLSNQLSLARVDDRRTCSPNAAFPEVVVATDGGGLAAGSPPGCGRLEAGHTVWELTDDIGLAVGSHALTFGVHGERIHLSENVSLNAAGSWEFEGLESLALGKPVRYTRDFLSAGDSRVAFRIDQISAYMQDQWPATPRLTVTAGLRLDVPFVATAPTRHAAIASLLGINTSLTPSGNALWSPRVGASYDVDSRGTTIVRGGAGLFAGQPAYVWFRNVYGSTGIRSRTITCADEAVPDFNLDPDAQPEACAGEAEPPPPVAYFDPALRFPQSLKVAVGIDQRLPAGVLGTLDLLYSRGVHNIGGRGREPHGPDGPRRRRRRTDALRDLRFHYRRGVSRADRRRAGRRPPAPEHERRALLLGHRSAGEGVREPGRAQRGVHLHRCERPDQHGPKPRGAQHRDTAERHAGAPRARHLLLGAATQGDRGGNGGPPPWLPDRPHLRRDVGRAVHLRHAG